MKNINRITAVLFAVIIGTLTFSCSDDGDDNVSADDLVKILMNGKWAFRDVSYHEGSGSHAWSYDVTETLYFTSENSGIAYILTKECDSELGNSRYTDWYMFSYYVNGNTVVITDESYNVTEYTYLKGGLSNGTGLYLPSSLTDSDYEILEKIGPKTGICGAGLKYSIDQRTYIITISGKGAMYDYDGGRAPWKEENIHTLIVEDGCTSIGNSAFYGCDLTDIHLCSSITRIGDNAFRATNMSSVELPPALQTIGKYAFAECSALRSVDFAVCDQLTTIEEAAFWGSKVNFGNCTMPKNLNTIGRFAFCNSTFKSLTLNDQLTTIEGGAFMNLNIVRLEIPNSVTTIGSGAFMGSIGEIRIGTGLTKIQGTPFFLATSGSLYVSTTSPRFFPEESFNYLISDMNGNNAVPKWDLYVPKGSKSKYANNSVWGKFRSINEY